MLKWILHRNHFIRGIFILRPNPNENVPELGAGFVCYDQHGQSFSCWAQLRELVIIWLLVIGSRIFEMLFVQKKWPGSSSEEWNIECQECFPISFLHSAAPRSRWGKLKSQRFLRLFYLFFNPAFIKNYLLDLIKQKAEVWCLKAMQTPMDVVKAVETARWTKNSHNALLCFILLSTPVCNSQEGLRGSMEMILLVSLDFSRGRAYGSDFLVGMKKSWIVSKSSL